MQFSVRDSIYDPKRNYIGGFRWDSDLQVYRVKKRAGL